MKNALNNKRIYKLIIPKEYINTEEYLNSKNLNQIYRFTWRIEPDGGEISAEVTPVNILNGSIYKQFDNFIEYYTSIENMSNEKKLQLDLERYYNAYIYEYNAYQNIRKRVLNSIIEKDLYIKIAKLLPEIFETMYSDFGKDLVTKNYFKRNKFEIKKYNNKKD